CSVSTLHLHPFPTRRSSDLSKRIGNNAPGTGVGGHAYAWRVSSTRLLILGVVRWFQPVHGYDVRREVLSWHADEWANVAPGSIYHALKKLAEEGLLREVSTEQVGARPARTRYEITAKGEEAFQDLHNRTWWDHKPAVNPCSMALTFLHSRPHETSTTTLRLPAHRPRLLR